MANFDLYKKHIVEEEFCGNRHFQLVIFRHYLYYFLMKFRSENSIIKA